MRQEKFIGPRRSNQIDEIEMYAIEIIAVQFASRSTDDDHALTVLLSTWARIRGPICALFVNDSDSDDTRASFTSAAREPEHQPRLVGYPVGVKLGHLVEQLFVGRRGLFQSIKIQQIALSVLDRRR